MDLLKKNEELISRIERNKKIELGVNELLGMCRMAVADQKIVQDEAEFLKNWLENHKEIAKTFPVNLLYDRVREALLDDHLDKDESSELLELLDHIIRSIRTDEFVYAFISAAETMLDRDKFLAIKNEATKILDNV